MTTATVQELQDAFAAATAPYPAAGHGLDDLRQWLALPPVETAAAEFFAGIDAIAADELRHHL